MHILWESTVYVGKYTIPCLICGRKSLPRRLRGNQFLLAVVYNQAGQVVGEACQECMQADPKEIQIRLRERLEALQAQLANLEALTQEPLTLPSLEAEFCSHRLLS